MTDSAISGSSPTPTLETVATLRKVVTSEEESLARRFRALFSLKHVASRTGPAAEEDAAEKAAVADAAVEAIAAAFASPSALLKHELAYCLGQSKRKSAVPYLENVLRDLNEDPMCRHEAAEALGAIGLADSLPVLKEFRDREGEVDVVTETCDIAVGRIEWENSKAKADEKLKSSDFASIDPAPPLPLETSPPTIPQLQTQLMDTSLPLFERYRAMFALRDLASPPDLPTAVPAIEALATGFADSSALFRHEIAFVFGQLSHPASIPALVKTLSDGNEVGMVRHEAAEALGSLGDEPGVEDVLRRFLDDPEQVVRDSVIVALDMAEFEKSGEQQYAIVPETAVNA